MLLLIGGVRALAQEPPAQVLPETRVTAPRPRPEAPPPPEPPLPAPEPPAPAVPTSPFTVPAVSGYRAESAVTGLGTQTPLLTTPATVTVIPRDLINDQQALRLDDLLRDVPGAIRNINPLFRPNEFVLRGFPLTSFGLRRDGFLDLSLVPRELANIQRVEVLQGPASVLYGGAQPSGVVNFITKAPQAEPYQSVQAEFGSFGLFRFTADATGPVGDSPNVFYRVNAASEDAGSFRDFVYTNRAFAAPALTWVIDEQTTLTVQGEYLYDRSFFDVGIVAPGGTLGPIPSSRSFNEPDDFIRENDFRLTTLFDHRFDEHWTLRLGEQSLWFPGDGQRTLPAQLIAPTPSAPATELVRIKQVISSYEQQYHSILADLVGTTETGCLTHHLLFGTELGCLLTPDFRLFQSNPIQTPLLLNIYQPVYNNARFGAPDPPLPFLTRIEQNQYRSGFFGQDLIDIGARWKLLAGVRADIVTNVYDQTSNIPIDFPAGATAPLAVPIQALSDVTYYHWSPRVGLVYEAIEDALALYGCYSQSFDPVFGRRADGRALSPETGVQWEGGFKADLLEKTLSFTAAGFYIVKDNVTFPDPTDDLFFVQLGRGRSQGVETSLTGNLTEVWSIIANYAYVDARTTQDVRSEFVGQRFQGVPFHNGSLWTRYNLLQESGQVLGVAVGLVALGDRPGDLQNSFALPGYLRWDLGLYYKRRGLSLSLYLENLFDTRYYAGSISTLQVFPGAPFTVRSAARWDF